MKSNETMDHLAERVRMLVGEHPGITEKYMFGGLTFLLNGHILVGCKKDGQILISVGKENAPAAAARSGATAMVHNNREMTGFFWIDPDAIEDDDDLAGWVDFAFKAVAAKPSKEVRPARKAPAKKAAAKTAPARKRTPS
ncbi:MAG: TfoX/Sxy family protein [Devosia sp.]|uniref:TfoX/Sxy family protein n=1 Tax=Devosia sp. TaxID=1871048 RepID=UPI001A370831|nr:TfoX/Sxy family protein [Devosia sp.]MBL8599262.1 TfoX/Sxy family protein [Devosia sp.]